MKRLLLSMAILALSATWSPAAGISTIFSADAPQYRQAFDGLQGVVRERKGVVRSVEHVVGKEEGESIVRDVTAEKPIVVLAIGSEAAKLAKERIKNIPVVFSMVLHPEPFAARNTTGVALEIPVRAKLDKIRKALPDAGRIGVLYSPASAAQYREVVQGCRALGLQAVGKEIDSGKELPEAFAVMVGQIDLFLMLPDSRIFFPKSIEHLLKEALRNKVPVVGLASSYTRAGALISFEADYRDVGRQAGEMAVRIMDGESPRGIPPERPRRIRTSVNLAVAERLGIRIDPRIAGEAGEVFR